jgi:ATP-dependent protease ClpP protease subunit
MIADAHRRGRQLKEKDQEKEEENQPLWGSAGHDDDAEIRLVGNHIYYYAPIMTRPVAVMIDALHTLANKLRIQAIENGGDPPPIVLHFNSPGGSIFAGVAAMDAVRLCPVPIHAVVDGMCASAATFPFMVAKKRLIGKDSYILIHQLSSWHAGKYEELLDDMKNSKAFMGQIREVYLRHTKIKRQKLDRILKHDIWFGAQKALKLGMVDEIV